MVLWHGDLTPKNLGCHLVRQNGLDGGQPQIRGMTEWFDLCAVPPVLARRPPVWLWAPDLAKKLGVQWDGETPRPSSSVFSYLGNNEAKTEREIRGAAPRHSCG
jgi:hypothetical protein